MLVLVLLFQKTKKKSTKNNIQYQGDSHRTPTEHHADLAECHTVTALHANCINFIWILVSCSHTHTHAEEESERKIEGMDIHYAHLVRTNLNSYYPRLKCTNVIKVYSYRLSTHKFVVEKPIQDETVNAFVLRRNTQKNYSRELCEI